MTPRLLIALLLALSACSAEGDGDARPSPSPDEPPVVQLIANNVELSRTTPLLIGIDAAAPSVSIIVGHDPEAHVDVYALETLESPLPREGCPIVRIRSCVRDIGRGVRESVDRGLRPPGAIAVAIRSGPPRVNVRLEYGERTRAVTLRIPSIPPPRGVAQCKDNACNPIVEMMPLRGGTFHATARFASGTGRLQLQSGRVLARSFSATGIPYRIPAEDAGASPLSLRSRLDAPAEYALALLNIDPARPLTAVSIEARWP